MDFFGHLKVWVKKEIINNPSPYNDLQTTLPKQTQPEKLSPISTPIFNPNEISDNLTLNETDTASNKTLLKSIFSCFNFESESSSSSNWNNNLGAANHHHHHQNQLFNHNFRDTNGRFDTYNNERMNYHQQSQQRHNSSTPQTIRTHNFHNNHVSGTKNYETEPIYLAQSITRCSSGDKTLDDFDSGCQMERSG